MDSQAHAGALEPPLTQSPTSQHLPVSPGWFSTLFSLTLAQHLLSSSASVGTGMGNVGSAMCVLLAESGAGPWVPVRACIHATISPCPREHKIQEQTNKKKTLTS